MYFAIGLFFVLGKALKKPIKMGPLGQWIEIVYWLKRSEVESKDWSIILFIITIKGKKSERSKVTKIPKSLTYEYYSSCDFLYCVDWGFQLFCWYFV